jgi:hypothetical protein
MGNDMKAAESGDTRHRWKFYRAGGVDQVMIRNGLDIANLTDLDQKLWVALAMPTRGIEFDAKTLDLIDTDKDGRIRPPEILAAIKWIRGALRNLDDLTRGGDSVLLSAINDQTPVGAGLLASARHILGEVGKGQSQSISLADVTDTTRIFASTRFNGDGVVPADSAETPEVRKVIEEMIATLGPVADRSGKPGVNQAKADAFFAQAAACVEWNDRSKLDPAILPLGDATGAAAAAVRAVRAKVDDYFARCRLATFDARALLAVNRQEAEYLALAAKDMTVSAQEVAGFPLSRVEPGRPLPLFQGVNPAWESALQALAVKAANPVIGAGQTVLTEAGWAAIQSRLAPFEAWMAAMPVTPVDKLGVARLRELLSGNTKEAVSALLKKDLALEAEFTQISAVEKLLLFHRDLLRLLNNYVTFTEFYGRKGAVFQSGTLFLDARACNLCIEVTDPGKHAGLAGLAGAFLAYCDCIRPGGQKKSIVAVFTDGDSDNLIAGRNGVYYDRKGQDWDATITRIVANPISIREAFWAPYKKLARMIEEQVAKRAAAADAEAQKGLGDVATLTANIDKAKPPAKPAEAKRIDLGTIALLGSAIGGASALVGAILKEFFGLGVWMPAGLLGVVLLISGPSMLIAWLKLRKRNLGPILDANGWAINTVAKMNVPFGAALTNVATLPAGAERSLDDPYAEKRRPWRTYATVGGILLLAALWYLGRLDDYLPGKAKSTSVLGVNAPAYKAPVVTPPAALPAAPAPATAGTNAPPAADLKK